MANTNDNSTKINGDTSTKPTSSTAQSNSQSQSAATTTAKTIGYIGLGNAGFSMSSNLPRKGYNLVVHDQDQSRVQRAVKQWQNTKAADPDDLEASFRDCDVIITMLPNGKVVREVVLGEKGFGRGLKRGTIIVDTSSSSPYDTQNLGKELEEYGLELVDSPITQTYMHATDDGESTLMVGCTSPETYSTVEPILRCLGRYVFHMGPLSAGHVMKTFNNYIMASSLVALNDSLVMGQKLGLDPVQMIEALNVGTGVCFPTLDTFRRDGITRRFNSGFGLALLIKDLGITKEVMENNSYETNLPDVVRGYLSQALEHTSDPKTADHTEALKGFEHRAGVQVRKADLPVKDIPPEDFEHRRRGLNRKD